MKKVLLLLAILATCLSTVAQTYRSGNFLFYLYGASESEAPHARITGMVSDAGEKLTIPQTVVKGDVTYTVTEIGPKFFSGTNLKKLTIPPTIKTFMKGAFSYLGQCDEVHISDLSAWAQAKFEDIAANPIRYQLYLNGKPLNNVEFSSDVTKISNYAFYWCASIQKVSFPSSVSLIGSSAFEGCTNLEDITWSEGLRTIDDAAFKNCYKLGDVVFPSSLKSVGGSAFYNSGITSAIFSTGEEEFNLYYFAFNKCKNLSHLKLPDNITVLHDGIVGECKRLRSLAIPSSVRLMRGDPFRGSYSLVRLDITDLSAWCKIDYNSDNDRLPTRNSFELYLNGEKITDLVIPDDISEIKERAFNHIKGIESITLPYNVKTVGKNAFGSGTRLTLGNYVRSAGDEAFPSTLEYVYYVNTIPIKLNRSAFSSISNTTLCVPRGYIDAFYSVSPWLYFGNIVEMDFSGLDEIEAVDSEMMCDVYSIAGMKVRGGVKWAEWNTGLTPGIYIVRLADGTVRKVSHRSK